MVTFDPYPITPYPYPTYPDPVYPDPYPQPDVNWHWYYPVSLSVIRLNTRSLFSLAFHLLISSKVALNDLCPCCSDIHQP